MKDGLIIFFRYKFNPISIVIRFFINLGYKKKCPYNHVGIIIKDENGEFHVVESNEKGVHSTPFKERVEGKNFMLRYIKFNEEGLKGYTEEHTGKKYDYWGTILHQGLFFITGSWFGHSQAFAGKVFYCSELVGKLINSCDESMYKEWHKLNPRDLYISSKIYRMNSSQNQKAYE